MLTQILTLERIGEKTFDNSEDVIVQFKTEGPSEAINALSNIIEEAETSGNLTQLITLDAPNKITISREWSDDSWAIYTNNDIDVHKTSIKNYMENSGWFATTDTQL